MLDRLVCVRGVPMGLADDEKEQGMWEQAEGAEQVGKACPGPAPFRDHGPSFSLR